MQSDTELEEMISNGCTLLFVDSQVKQWLQWEEVKGISDIPRTHGDFVEVSPE